MKFEYGAEIVKGNRIVIWKKGSKSYSPVAVVYLSASNPSFVRQMVLNTLKMSKNVDKVFNVLIYSFRFVSNPSELKDSVLRLIRKVIGDPSSVPVFEALVYVNVNPSMEGVITME